MRTKWLVVLMFFGLAAFVASCGGSSRDTGYVDPYADEMGDAGKGGGAPPPPVSGGSVDPMTPTGDSTADGTWGARQYAGSGRPGDQMTKADYDAMKKIGQDYNEARKLYQTYFSAKEKGQEDKSSLERAISLYDQLMTRLENMQQSHPDNHSVEEYFSNVSQERRNLLLER
jgi:hypothetical protein